jgi:acyl-CoA thioesterase-2
MIHGSVNDLFHLLTVQPGPKDEFIGLQVAQERSRVYGGQFLGQGLMAALAHTDSPARSLQCLYLRPGSTDKPLTYATARAAEDLIEVQTLQNGKCLFRMDVRTGKPTGAPNVSMPSVPSPGDCISREEGIRGLDSDTDSTWAVVDSPFEYRFAENIWANDYREPKHHVWFRARDVSPAQRAWPQSLQQASLAYFSDDNIMDNALFPHGWHNCWSNLQTASLDHSLWFHQPVDLSEWLLFAQDSPVASHGRGLTRGLFFNEDGRLVASAYQEILMR